MFGIRERILLLFLICFVMLGIILVSDDKSTKLI